VRLQLPLVKSSEEKVTQNKLVATTGKGDARERYCWFSARESALQQQKH